ncbi:MAG: leucyl/phenylalanyl-tRNA--protein transferase [Bacteroidota bacterium]|nr:leucyl/phenylalanyl-tRNA--protein transferase [Bacteroidota bacterium]
MPLKPEILIQAYASGAFPMADPEEDNQIYWHTPQMRGVIPLDDRFKISKNLMRLYKKDKFDLYINRNFHQVIDYCRSLRENDTWISDEILDAYKQLHEGGFAHSFEVYEEGKLVGGLYGVSIGKAFFGESMFHLVTDASKIALVFLVEFLREHDFLLLDTQYLNPHIAQFGAYEITHQEYVKLLRRAIAAS